MVAECADMEARLEEKRKEVVRLKEFKKKSQFSQIRFKIYNEEHNPLLASRNQHTSLSQPNIDIVSPQPPIYPQDMTHLNTHSQAQHAPISQQVTSYSSDEITGNLIKLFVEAITANRNLMYFLETL